MLSVVSLHALVMADQPAVSGRSLQVWEAFFANIGRVKAPVVLSPSDAAIGLLATPGWDSEDRFHETVPDLSCAEPCSLHWTEAFVKSILGSSFAPASLALLAVCSRCSLSLAAVASWFGSPRHLETVSACVPSLLDSSPLSVSATEARLSPDERLIVRLCFGVAADVDALPLSPLPPQHASSRPRRQLKSLQSRYASVT
jgi:hypothetical protein